MNDMSRAQVESLVLFEVLDPKPEVLVIGLGERMRTFLPPDVLEHFKVGALIVCARRRAAPPDGEFERRDDGVGTTMT